jgi:cyclopropane fatty-acyl-phospholipid synthase-like methyltransferase
MENQEDVELLWKRAKELSSWYRRKNNSFNYWEEYNRRKVREVFNEEGKIKDSFYKEELERIKKFVNPNYTILDIGAGYGRLTIPLAKTARKVVAIEPSKEGIKIMKNLAEKLNLQNIEFINKKWEEVNLDEKYDLVICTYLEQLLTPEFLIKMHNASKGYCYIELPAGSLEYHFYSRIYPMIMREKFERGIDYIHILLILYAQKIYANVEIYETEAEKIFNTLNEALEEWEFRLSYFIDITPEVRRKLVEYYMKNSKNGLFMDRYKVRTAVIWWKV